MKSEKYKNDGVANLGAENSNMTFFIGIDAFLINY